MIIKRILLSLVITGSCVSLKGAITHQVSCPNLQLEALKNALVATFCLREKKPIHDNFGFLSLPTMQRSNSCPNFLNRHISITVEPFQEDACNNEKTFSPQERESFGAPCCCQFQKDYFEEARACVLLFKKPAETLSIQETPVAQKELSAKPTIIPTQEDKKDYVDACKRLNESFDYLLGPKSFVPFCKKKEALQWMLGEANNWFDKNTPNKRNFVTIFLRAKEYLKKIADVEESIKAIIAREDVD